MRRNSLSMPQTRGNSVFRTNKFNGGGAKNSQKRGRGQYIDPKKFVNAAITPQAEVAYISTHQFSDFAFSDQLKQAIAGRGYVDPTPIQDQVIVSALSGRDIVGLANTGTGKTAAFVLPIIEQLDKKRDGSTALIIAPTRELAVQINDEFKAFAQNMRLYSTLCLGGVNANRQIEQLRRKPQVVIGTPGRLKDLFNRGELKLNRTSIVVLDEADRMLDMGFIRDIRFILGKLPEQKQSMCFSATLPADIKVLLEELLHNPVTVSVRTTETSEHVEQNVLRASSKQEKIDILDELLRKPEFDKVMIFSETKWGAQKLADSLKASGITAEAIHGNKSQPQRQRALNAFKDGRVAVLVATDVAARGIDIPNVSHVINFDQPATYEDYVHRIGRTGRAGKRGHALTFVSHGA